MDSREILIKLVLCYGDNWDDIYKILVNKDLDVMKNLEDEEPKGIEVNVKILKNLHDGYKVVTMIDEDYPKALLTVTKAPFVVFYKGDTNTIYEKVMAKIGTSLINSKAMYFVD